MDPDPPASLPTLPITANTTQTPDRNGVGRSRALRARPSDPGPSSITVPSPSAAAGIRRLSQKELDSIHRRLGDENVRARRDEIVHAKEVELKDVVESHEIAVKEKFHLERFISILEGWDPEHAKTENSPVFLDWKDTRHNLLNLLPDPAPIAGPSSRAGPSRGPTHLPSRTTRRQAHQQSEILTSVVAPVIPVNGHASSHKAKGKAVEGPVESIPGPTSTKGNAAHPLEDPQGASLNGRGKARRRTSEIMVESVSGDTIEKPGRAPKHESATMLPPPIPLTKGRGSRRATINTHTVDTAKVEPSAEHVEDPGGKGKKRARMSLPALPVAKKLRGSKTPTEEPEIISSPSIPTPTETSREPTPPAPLPSLSHLPFPPVPDRPKERFFGPKRIVYTDPTQRPASDPKHNGHISPILDSYIHIEDSGAQPDLPALESRALKDGYYRARVMYLQAHGRLQRLLDEATTDDLALSRNASHKAKPTAVTRKTDFQDSLMAHMMQVRNAMLNEAKSKPVVCKRIARMVQTYWERIEGREERERLAEEKERKRVGKELIKGLRKRWALAVKIIRAKVLEAQKLEQDRLGKEHLQNMLQRSTGLLEAQVAGPEDDASDDESQGDSDGTEDVSSAEESDDEGQEQQGDVDGKVSVLPVSSPPPDSMFEGDAKGIEDDEEDDQDQGDEQQGQADLRLMASEDAIITDAEETEAMLVISEAAPRSGIDMANAAVVEPPATASGPNDKVASAIDPVGALSVGQANGNETPISDTASNDHVSPFPVPRSRRARTIVTSKPLTTEDPDANDIEFDGAPTSDLDEQDAVLDEEMEDEEGTDQVDSEDEGLLKDADIPIEELLKRYGYPVPNGQMVEAENTLEDADEAIAVEPQVNGAITTDRSLVDEALPALPVSPQLIVEGKRQRRARSVWSPDAEKPQQLVHKRPRIELVDPTDDDELEATPELISEEESEDEDQGDLDEEIEVDEKNDDGPKIRPPFLLRGTLRPYQQGGLEWLASLWQNGMNGILADEMGLGKTIQTISLLAYLACDKGIWGQHLIIVPTSVILNWEMEFKKFLPGMKVLTYYGNQKERKEKRIGWHTENAWQVCITSYQIVLADQHIFRRKNWCYMILDEAHNIKNFRSQRWQTLLGFKAQRRLLLTGTPLQNNLMELWSLLYFLMPGGIGADATAVVGFANHKEFMEWFSNPMDKAVESGDTMDEETLATVAKLHTLLRPFILRRLKAEVETQLPGKFEHVVYCRLSKRQRFLYDEFMSRASTREALTSGGYLGVMNTLMQLRKVCNHPDLFEVRPVRTSFAMESVAAEFEPKELLLRRRLLQQDDNDRTDIISLGLGVTANERESGWVCRSRSTLDASDKLPYAMEPVLVRRGKASAGPKKDPRTVEGWLKYRAWADEQARMVRWRSLRDVNRRRCAPQPIFGSTLLKMLGRTPNHLLPSDVRPQRDELFGEHRPPAGDLGLVLSLPGRAKTLESIIDFFAVVPPNVVARNLASYALPGLEPISHPSLTDQSFDTLHRSTVKLQIAFPDSSLLQYDCGKLQTLATMLRNLKAGGHRVLIFTQMTRVLDILEIFLSYNGHRYLRLDGSTKIEDRQIITERFNSDPRFFVFIASSRSGGVGINLTGADTVFFYDSDWNPSMDRQCMDRAHRIGQTREVHIYRFVSSHTVEENMLRKAEQKRLLDKMVIQEGGFNNDWWGRVGWKDMFGDVPGLSDPAQGDGAATSAEGQGVVDVDVEATPIAEDVEQLRPRAGEERELARVLAEVEDEEDVQAARMAQGEGELDFQEFEDARATGGAGIAKKGTVAFDARAGTEGSATPITPITPALADDVMADEEEEEEEGDDVGGVEDYMLKWVEVDWEYFVGYRA